MKIVLVKHNKDSRTFLFEVPKSVDLKENELVLAETRFGEESGVCICDSFELDESPLNALGYLCGAKFPLKPVLGKIHVERFEDVIEDDGES